MRVHWENGGMVVQDGEGGKCKVYETRITKDKDLTAEAFQKLGGLVSEVFGTEEGGVWFRVWGKKKHGRR